MRFDPMAPVEQKFSSWMNPTDKPVRVDVYVGCSTSNLSGRIRFQWKPGETRVLPSEYDAAVHQVVDGVIVGGQAPQLRKEGATDVLHPALDPEGSARQAAVAEAERAFAVKKVAEEALLVASARAGGKTK